MSGVTLGPADRPPLVFVHGLALDHRDLQPLGELAAAAGWRTFLWDMPGHGTGGPLPDPCELSAFADAFEDYLRAQAIAAPVVVGFSFGGMVVQEILRRRRTPLRAFVAFGCLAPFSTLPPLDAPTQAVVLQAMEAMAWPDLRAAFIAACCSTPAAQAAIEPVVERAGREKLLAMTRALYAAFDPDPAFAIDVPLLLLRGEHDSNTASLEPAFGALRKAAHGDCEERVIAGAGHCAALDRPDETGAALAEFLDRLSAGAMPASRSTAG